MDPITKHSAAIATCIHACLIFLAFMPRGCSTVPLDESTPPPPPSAESPVPVSAPEPIDDQKKPTVPEPVYAHIIAVPQTTTAPPPLPTLGDGDLPGLPPLGDLITAVKQDHPGLNQAVGNDQTGSTLVNLPEIPSTQDDLIGRLQGQRTSNKELSREQRMLATAQEFLHGRLQSQIENHWPHLLKKVTERRLIIEFRVDEHGKMTLARLVNSSGSLTLDRLIDEWLRDSKLSLPPITPNVTYPFLVVLRHS